MPAMHNLLVHDVRLKQLNLNGFRGFRNVTLDFNPDKPVTVLIADNDGGKSTVLDAAAAFLRRFFHLAIAGKSEEDNTDTLLGEKDIFNGINNAVASVALNLSYPFPDKEVFEWVDDCARFLNENLIEGEEAVLGLEDGIWVLQLKQQKEIVTYYLPDKFQHIPEDLEKMFNEMSDFKVAIYNDEEWRPTLFSAQSWREAKLEFELTRGRPDPIKFNAISSKPKTYTDFIRALEENKGFIQDYAYSASGYNCYNPLDENPVVLPLLAYYSGAAINAKYDNELKVPYRHGKFQAYSRALEPERFDFEEFITWALWAVEKQKYAWEVVKDTILDVMNASSDSAKYETIQIEAQTLVFYKKTGTIPMPVEAAQLSAGEKNIMALVGDLAKRAVQLNAVLFKVDVDHETGSLSNPLHHTPGIVLIDEIDLHLHPRWQRVIVPKLQEHFPKLQFVVTTHSPFVLQSVPPAQRIRLNYWQPEYFVDETVSDYEATLIDYFMVTDFFDMDTEKKLKEFRRYLREVATNRRDKKDAEFVKIIKILSEKGDVIKRVIALELAQLTKNDKNQL
jgi:predicted ATP-binding protein involved in virulence